MARAAGLAVVFGSQTGTAESIAQRISNSATSAGFVVAFTGSLNDAVTGLDWAADPLVVICVTSTTGDGDPPDNATKYWRFLGKLRREKRTLKHLRYALLGLGDTNYNQFCNAGKGIDKKWRDLEATALCDCGWADDATGLENVVEPWITELWTLLEQVVERDASKPMPAAESSGIDVAHELAKLMDKLAMKSKSEDPWHPYVVQLGQKVPEERVWSLSDDHKQKEFGPYSPCVSEAYMTDARILTGPNAVKKTMSVTLEIPNRSSDSMEPGDAIALFCPNPAVIVEAILDMSSVDGNSTCKETIGAESKRSQPHFAGIILPVLPSLSNIDGDGLCIRDALTYHYDLTGPVSLEMYAHLASIATEKSEKKVLKLLSNLSSTDLRQKLKDAHLNVADVLASFPSCRTDLTGVLARLKLMPPRYYSIASTGKCGACPTISFAFNQIAHLNSDTRLLRPGLCTSWLESLARKSVSAGRPAARIPVFARPSHPFRVPQQPSTHPFLFVGPGVGVAVLVGMIQTLSERRLEMKGPTYLFFGCRDLDHEWIYESEMRSFLRSGHIDRLYLHASRQTDEELRTRTDADPELSAWASEGRLRVSSGYVQGSMKGDGEVLMQHMRAGGHFLLCGDANGMARDVRETWLSLVRRTGESDPDTLLQAWHNEGRYLQDVWSS